MTTHATAVRYEVYMWKTVVLLAAYRDQCVTEYTQQLTYSCTGRWTRLELE